MEGVSCQRCRAARSHSPRVAQYRLRHALHLQLTDDLAHLDAGISKDRRRRRIGTVFRLHARRQGGALADRRRDGTTRPWDARHGADQLSPRTLFGSGSERPIQREESAETRLSAERQAIPGQRHGMDRNRRRACGKYPTHRVAGARVHGVLRRRRQLARCDDEAEADDGIEG